MHYESPFALVQAWQDAANSQNIKRIRLIAINIPPKLPHAKQKAQFLHYSF